MVSPMDLNLPPQAAPSTTNYELSTNNWFLSAHKKCCRSYVFLFFFSAFAPPTISLISVVIAA